MPIEAGDGRGNVILSANSSICNFHFQNFETLFTYKTNAQAAGYHHFHIITKPSTDPDRPTCKSHQ